MGGTGNSLSVTTGQYYLEQVGSGVRLLVDNAGQVGIGTTTPAAKLDIVGDLKVSGNYIGSISSTGTLALPNTTNSTTGVLTLGGTPFLHSFGADNTFVGRDAGNFTMTGSGSNTGIGRLALQQNVTGFHNTASGYAALRSNTAGYHNTASGVAALFSNTTGFANTATGRSAMNANTEGRENTANGAFALMNNQGNENTASGALALLNNLGGNGNTALGYLAGHTTAGFGNGNDSYNTYLGWNAGKGAAVSITNATAIGANAGVSASNSLVLGDANVKVGIGHPAPYTDLHIYRFRDGVIGPVLTLMNGGSSISPGSGTAIDFSNFHMPPDLPPSARIQSMNALDFSSHLAFMTKIPGASGNALDERMRITSTGNIGIGTAAPTAKLHVVGDVLSTGTVTATAFSGGSGGVKLASGGAKPTCDAAVRGTIWATLDGVGAVNDKIEVCVWWDGAFTWRNIGGIE